MEVEAVVESPAPVTTQISTQSSQNDSGGDDSSKENKENTKDNREQNKNIKKKGTREDTTCTICMIPLITFVVRNGCYKQTMNISLYR